MNGTSRIISLCQGLWPGQQASACPHSDAIEIVKSAALFSLMALLDNKTFIFTLSRIVCSVEVQCHSSYRKHFILSLLATSFGALVAATWHMRETAGDCMALCFPKPTVGDLQWTSPQVSGRYLVAAPRWLWPKCHTTIGFKSVGHHSAAQYIEWMCAGTQTSTHFSTIPVFGTIEDSFAGPDRSNCPLLSI